MNRRAILTLLVLGGCARKPEPAPAPPPPPVTRLVLGGDVMLSRHVGRLARRQKDPAAPFRAIAPFLSAAHIAFVNLESPFSDRGKPVERGMIFKAEPSTVEGLVLAGIDVVSTANNHARDQGGYGLEYTVGWLKRHGIQAV
ncbi:MAG: CapA family protein, partial [Bryobacterales bacterium]|nr:CapA family protein [Bryobacterales bacterium]